MKEMIFWGGGGGGVDLGEKYWTRDCLVQIYSCLSKNKDKIKPKL